MFNNHLINSALNLSVTVESAGRVLQFLTNNDRLNVINTSVVIVLLNKNKKNSGTCNE